MAFTHIWILPPPTGNCQTHQDYSKNKTPNGGKMWNANKPEIHATQAKTAIETLVYSTPK
jgi:SRSO17 transposase